MSWLRKKLRKLEKRFGPQIVERRIGEFNLRMHRDHVLPIKLAKFPNYSANVPRIAALLVEKYPGMALVDVGANIGDTVALVRSKVTCPIVCIEGDEEFFSLLKGNTSQFKDVTLFSNFVSDGDARMAGEVVRHDGTAHLVANDGKSVDVTTLDSLKEQHAAAFENVRLLKIDTIFCYNPWGHDEENPDHYVTAQCVEAACWMAGMDKDYPEHFAAGLQPHGVQEKYYFARGPQLVNRVVDITGVIERKIDAMLVNKAQGPAGNNGARLRASLAERKLRLPILGGDDVTANREYVREFLLTREEETGKRHGLKYAEEYHYIGPPTSPIEDYIKRQSVPL